MRKMPGALALLGGMLTLTLAAPAAALACTPISVVYGLALPPSGPAAGGVLYVVSEGQPVQQAELTNEGGAEIPLVYEGNWVKASQDRYLSALRLPAEIPPGGYTFVPLIPVVDTTVPLTVKSAYAEVAFEGALAITDAVAEVDRAEAEGTCVTPGPAVDHLSFGVTWSLPVAPAPGFVFIAQFSDGLAAFRELSASGPLELQASTDVFGAIPTAFCAEGWVFDPSGAEVAHLERCYDPQDEVETPSPVPTPGATPTATALPPPSPTPSPGAPTPTLAPTAPPSPTASPRPTADPTAGITPTPTALPTAGPTETPRATATETQAPTEIPDPTPSGGSDEGEGCAGCGGESALFFFLLPLGIRRRL